MIRKTLGVSLLVLSVLFLSVPAFANLAALGPINTANGFPLWYQDTNGVVLDLPTPPIGDGGVSGLVNPTQIFLPPDGTAFSNQIGFGAEAFYYYARARMDVNSGDPANPGKAELIMGLEASFLNGLTPVDGEQMVFTRLRIRVDIPATGAGQTYTVRHPYGVQIFNNVAAGTRGINSTIDTGLVPLNFNVALGGQIGPFLAQSPPPPINPVSGSWIGDGFTVGPVTGSPRGFNTFRIEGTDIGGPGVNFVETTLFLVSGHIFGGGGTTPPPPALPLTADRITYARTQANTTLEIFASSTAGATVTATIPGVAAPITLTPGTGVLNGTFFGTVTVPNPFTLPTSIQLDATLGTATATVTSGAPQDIVTITRAEYVAKSGRLRIQVVSSDQTGNPTMTMTAPIVRSFRLGKLELVMAANIPLFQVTVQSSAGGSTTATVTLK